jgi:hypothetical protein
VRHRAAPSFREEYRALDPDVRKLADKSFEGFNKAVLSTRRFGLRRRAASGRLGSGFIIAPFPSRFQAGCSGSDWRSRQVRPACGLKKASLSGAALRSLPRGRGLDGQLTGRGFHGIDLPEPRLGTIIVRVSDHSEAANPTAGRAGKVAPIGAAAQVVPVA